MCNKELGIIVSTWLAEEISICAARSAGYGELVQVLRERAS